MTPMKVPATPMPEDELLKAVKALNDTVQKLVKSLEEYPKRAEIERKYASREDQKRARKQFRSFVIVALVASLVFSFFSITGTISTCFLSAQARAGHAPGACNYLPGFKDATTEQKRLRKQFNQLLRIPVENDRRLDRIEKKLGMRP